MRRCPPSTADGQEGTAAGPPVVVVERGETGVFPLDRLDVVARADDELEEAAALVVGHVGQAEQGVGVKQERVASERQVLLPHRHGVGQDAAADREVAAEREASVGLELLGRGRCQTPFLRNLAQEEVDPREGLREPAARAVLTFLDEEPDDVADRVGIVAGGPVRLCDDIAELEVRSKEHVPLVGTGPSVLARRVGERQLDEAAQGFGCDERARALCISGDVEGLLPRRGLGPRAEEGGLRFDDPVRHERGRDRRTESEPVRGREPLETFEHFAEGATLRGHLVPLDLDGYVVQDAVMKGRGRLGRRDEEGALAVPVGRFDLALEVSVGHLSLGAGSSLVGSASAEARRRAAWARNASRSGRSACSAWSSWRDKFSRAADGSIHRSSWSQSMALGRGRPMRRGSEPRRRRRGVQCREGYRRTCAPSSPRPSACPLPSRRRGRTTGSRGSPGHCFG